MKHSDYAVALERDLQCHRFGHRMSPIVDTQLPQNFLNMVFNGKRADIEQVCDFKIVFAYLNVTQNFRLPVRNEFFAFSRRGAMRVITLMEQHAHQRHMHVGH